MHVLQASHQPRRIRCLATLATFFVVFLRWWRLVLLVTLDSSPRLTCCSPVALPVCPRHHSDPRGLCHLYPFMPSVEQHTALQNVLNTVDSFHFTGGNPRASVWPTEISWPMFDGMSNIISWATRTEETRSLCKICGEIEVKHQVFGVTVRTVCHIWRVSPLMLPWRTAGCEILGGLIWRKY